MKRPERAEQRRLRGGAARKTGRRAEALAALWLMAKGYRILGFRLRTRLGEIDLLAQKGTVLAVVEVKQRATLNAALEAVSLEQRQRLRRAGEAVAGARPRLKALAVRLDLVALSPGRWPAHLADAWPGS
ncbi:YraN family protein [Phenylobacterium sp.]|uniref:YraN family protein n=1 Tax=Phenylobacterium sp. TaxID=1871053 RepID=UPI002FD9ED6F